MADKHTGRQWLLGGLVAVLVPLGVAVLTNVLLPRLVRRDLHRVKQNTTIMRSLRWANGVRLKSAGSQRSATAILTHVGRRSGRRYKTPVGAAAYGDGFILPLAYGSGTDWCRNVMAAGTCTLVWKGRTVDLDRPEIISGPEVMQAWPAWIRIMLQGGAIREFLWVHKKPADPHVDSRPSQ